MKNNLVKIFQQFLKLESILITFNEYFDSDQFLIISIVINERMLIDIILHDRGDNNT